MGLYVLYSGVPSSGVLKYVASSSRASLILHSCKTALDRDCIGSSGIFRGGEKSFGKRRRSQLHRISLLSEVSDSFSSISGCCTCTLPCVRVLASHLCIA